MFNRSVEDVEEIEEVTPKWKISLEKQLSKCIKDVYSEEICLKFSEIKNMNSLCKKISKSVLNSIYEEDIIKHISLSSNIKYSTDMSEEDKLKISKKLKNSFNDKELEFLRYEVSDSISRLKKEWLSV